jgi:hypothetical protein
MVEQAKRRRKVVGVWAKEAEIWGPERSKDI